MTFSPLSPSLGSAPSKGRVWSRSTALIYYILPQLTQIWTPLSQTQVWDPREPQSYCPPTPLADPVLPSATTDPCIVQPDCPQVNMPPPIVWLGQTAHDCYSLPTTQSCDQIIPHSTPRPYLAQSHCLPSWLLLSSQHFR